MSPATAPHVRVSGQVQIQAALQADLWRRHGCFNRTFQVSLMLFTQEILEHCAARVRPDLARGTGYTKILALFANLYGLKKVVRCS